MSESRKITVIEPIKKKVSDSTNSSTQKLKVAAYARVSTEMDEQQSSYEAQVDFYTTYINSNPEWEFVKVFADRGITGTSIKNRDSFNEMVSLALNGGIDLILTKSISRFARNTVDTLQTVRELKAAGVEVIFEKENLRTFDPKCEMMLTIMSSLAQEESRSISENVRWGKEKSMQDGKVTVPYSSFLGYCKGEDGNLQIVEKEAEVVREIFDLFVEGKTAKHIARILTEKGIPTPRGKCVWSVATIMSILQNEKYKGDALLQKTYVEDYLTKKVRRNQGEVRQYYVEHNHAPIIDSEVFDRVQEMIAKRKRYTSKVRDSSPFCNLLICGDCGEFYGRKVWHNRGNTERYGVWYCNAKFRREDVCSTPTIKENDLITIFNKLLEKMEIDQGDSPEQMWRETIDHVIVNADSTLIFYLKDGRDVRLYI